MNIAICLSWRSEIVIGNLIERLVRFMACWHAKLKISTHLTRWHAKLKYWDTFCTLGRWHVGTLLARWHVEHGGTYGTQFSKFTPTSSYRDAFLLSTFVYINVWVYLCPIYVIYWKNVLKTWMKETKKFQVAKVQSQCYLDFAYFFVNFRLVLLIKVVLIKKSVLTTLMDRMSHISLFVAAIFIFLPSMKNVNIPNKEIFPKLTLVKLCFFTASQQKMLT